MLNSIKALIDSLNSTISRKDVIKHLELMFQSISEDVIPSLEQLEDGVDNIEKDKLAKLKNLAAVAGIKYKDNKDLVNKIKLSFINIQKEYSTLSDLVNKELNEIVTNKTITAKDAVILRVISDIGAMNSYVLDFSYYLLINDKETNLPKYKLKTITDGISTFASLYKVYGDNIHKLLQDVYKTSDNQLDVNDESEMTGIMLSKTGKLVNLPQANGFINNPIYHIRLWLTDREINKYEALKDKKRLIELKVLELKLKQSNSNEPGLSKQIEYYEEKLSKTEHAIERIEQN